MTDEQLHRRLVSKRLMVVALLLIMAAVGLLYYRSTLLPEIATYRSLKAQEAGLQERLNQLRQTNDGLSATIEENGKQLVSFSEDRIVFINRASELATKYNIGVNELSVTDIWTEGQMAGMTTRVEVQGPLEGVRGFISDYCDVKYTNRITHVSCRPTDEYPWMFRYIDELQVLNWLDLSAEIDKYNKENEDAIREQQQAILAAGGTVADIQAMQNGHSITLDDMFKQFTFKLYIEVDFLGRQ